MSARIISYSQAPKEEFIGMETPADLIAYAARVSNPQNQMNSKTAPKLLAYLRKHKHWSPFEMVSVCLEIETTRDIARQMLRHRSFSFQEFSQRYADIRTMKDEFVIREARLQDPKNRQNSINIEKDPSIQDNIKMQELISEWQRRQAGVINIAKQAYDWAIENGIAKEQARAVLPEGNTKSRLYVNGTVRSWIHYLELRTGNGTQKEHMEIAEQIAKVISTVYPL
jgi:thymidylate synthase (FAD)